MLRATLGMSAEAQRRGAARATMLSVPGTGARSCCAAPTKPREGLEKGALLQVMARADGVQACGCPTSTHHSPHLKSPCFPSGPGSGWHRPAPAGALPPRPAQDTGISFKPIAAARLGSTEIRGCGSPTSWQVTGGAQPPWGWHCTPVGQDEVLPLPQSIHFCHHSL